MIETFGSADEKRFLVWRESNRSGGYVASMRTARHAVLHEASCGHLDDVEGGFKRRRPMVGATKGRDELEEHLVGKGIEFSRDQDCG